MKPKYKPVILALDGISISDALSIVEDLKDCVDIFKLHSIIWERQIGTSILDYDYLISSINDANKKVFLDMKFHDIPSTMILHIEKVCHRVEFFTFHLSAGKSARSEMGKYQASTGIGALTSLSDNDCIEQFGSTRKTYALNLIKLGVECRIQNFVCGYEELTETRILSPHGTIIVPGVTISGEPNISQKITTNWQNAISGGADYVVMGRSILNLPRIERKQVIEGINIEVERIRNS